VPLVRGDIGLIERAVGNLLANSISYTPEDGSIYVEMSRTDTGVLMSVSDDGRGISPDDLPHIFERFYRGKDAKDKEKGGTGLGLAIARRIIQLHGGDIEVRSEQNEGSIFTFSLPIWDPDHGQDKS
jgi:signal transduction histidine kinase